MNKKQTLLYLNYLANIHKKKPRLDTDFILQDIDETHIESQISNSSITITKIPNSNKDDISYRKPLNFDHLKKSKDLNLTFSNGRKSVIRMFESEDSYQVTMLEN